MANYKIAIIGLLLANNTVAKYGTVVSAEQLVGDPQKLVDEGFIVASDDEDTTEAAQAAADALKVQQEADAKAAADKAAADAQAKADAAKAKADAKAASDAAAKQAAADANNTQGPDPAAILNQGK
jgi:membrane protein involved in colicin uptake